MDKLSIYRELFICTHHEDPLTHRPFAGDLNLLIRMESNIMIYAIGSFGFPFTFLTISYMLSSLNDLPHGHELKGIPATCQAYVILTGSRLNFVPFAFHDPDVE